MAVILTKGQKVDLTKNNPGLKKILLGLGWDTNKYSDSKDFDLDASAFLVSVGNKVQDEDFIFYNNLVHSSGAVTHTGDNRTGDGDGDDEQIKIDFSKIPSNIEKIAITVTIHEAIERGQNFGQVSNAYIKLVDEETGKELLRYDLGEDYSIETALIFAEIYKHGNDWKFNALGNGFQNGLSELCKNYGLDI